MQAHKHDNKRKSTAHTIRNIKHEMTLTSAGDLAGSWLNRRKHSVEEQKWTNFAINSSKFRSKNQQTRRFCVGIRVKNSVAKILRFAKGGMI